MSMPHFQGRRIYRDDGTTRPSQSSSAGTPGSAVEPKPQWLSAAKLSKEASKQVPRNARLTQEKLIFPGEAGSGVVTPRGSSKGQKQSIAEPSSSSSFKVKASSKLSGTIDAFFVTREAAAPSRSTKSKQLRTSQGKGKAALTFAPATQSTKGKERVVHVVLDESQVDSPSANAWSGLEKQEQQQRHNEDATTTGPISEDETDLRSDRSDYLSAREDVTSQLVPPQVNLFDPSTYQLPPMPMPIPIPQPIKSIFGFGALPPLKPDGKEKSKKRKRAVVESSSPIKLAGPSSPAIPTKFHPSDPIETQPAILAQETAVTMNSVNEVEHTSNTMKKVGHGDRIAWGTQDESEYRRLNRTESERLIDEQLVVRRGPREAFPATQERTDYMDRYRSESYSPVQYTATETQMNEFRRRMGLSPAKRKAPTPKQPKTSLNMPMMDLDDDEATEVSEPPSQRAAVHESFDESATQQSTFTSSPPRPVGPRQNKADDSGFGDSSPRHETSHRGSGGTTAHDVTSSSPGKGPLLDNILKQGMEDMAVRSEPEDINDEEEYQIPMAEDTSLSSGDESDFDESTIVRQPRERRILALATQETEDMETQFISVQETQDLTRRSVSLQETQLVPCSQGESSCELDMDLAQGSQLGETETTRVAKAASSARAKSKSQKSVSKQIDAAWFPQVLASATAAASAKGNEQEQSTLTDFFRKKPNGPAERAAAEKAAREKEFANAVFKQRRDSRKGVKAGSSLDVLVEGDDDDIEEGDDDRLPSKAGAAAELPDVAEVEDSDMEEDYSVELESQSKSDTRLPCEGWVLGQKRHKTPTPVKQYRHREIPRANLEA